MNDKKQQEDVIAKPIGSPVSAYVFSKRILLELKTKTVLDCPSGQGAFAKILMENGIEVSCCDIRPEEFKLKELVCKPCDMNNSLPYEDSTFDAVTCLNGLHRLWARGRAVSELARVVKPGGCIIITIPNPTNIMRRLSYFATGVSVPNTVGPPDCFSAKVNPPSGHVRLPLSIPEIDASANELGLLIKEVKSIHTCKASLLLFTLIFPVWLLAPIFRARGRISHCKYVNTFSSLMSERILIHLQKGGG